MKGKKKIQNQTLILSLSDNTIEVALLEIYPSLEATMSTREQYWLQRVVTSKGSRKSVSWIHVCKAWDQVSHQTTQWLLSISIWSTFKPHWNVSVCMFNCVSPPLPSLSAGFTWIGRFIWGTNKKEYQHEWSLSICLSTGHLFTIDSTRSKQPQNNCFVVLSTFHWYIYKNNAH